MFLVRRMRPDEHAARPKVGIGGAAQGDAAAQAFIGGAAAARQFAGGVDALTARIRRQLGGVAASQAYSLDAQFRRMRESVIALFLGRNIDPFLSGLKNITDMFSQSTEFGQRLHKAVGGMFDALLRVATRALPFVKGALLGAAIAAAEMYLFALDIYDAISDWAKPLLKSTGLFNDATGAIKAGAPAAPAPTVLAPAGESTFDIPKEVMYGAIAAIGLGVIALFTTVLAGGGSDKRPTLASQLEIYGATASSSATARAAAAQSNDFSGLAQQARQAAETVLTSNKGFEQWGEVLGDDVMAAALIDRVLHHCHLVNIRGNSYRMREHTELHRALLQSDVEEPAEAVRRSRKSKASAAH